MSHIISNPYVERDMTDLFVCVLYFRDNNDLDIRNNGMDPYRIWDRLGYRAFDDSVVPIILDQLIYNNVNRRFIQFNTATRRVLLTNEGRQWAEEECRTRAGVLG
jgi:hypothetical protein